MSARKSETSSWPGLAAHEGEKVGVRLRRRKMESEMLVRER